MKVLIVDDIPTNRKLLRVLLEAEGIEIVEAADGVEALEALGREEVGAVISDILMPRLDGYQFCQKVRRDDRLRELPFIFYTSTYTSPGDEKLATDCGGDRYIKKPAPASVMVGALRELSDPKWRRTESPAPAEESLVMREYNEVLVRKLEERNDKLEKAREEIALANQELERRVEERTAELVLANKELEAFSHSIAHDLRTPISVINGFSSLLVNECRGKVSPRAMECLNFITRSASQMGDLTSDLLRLARANRAEMSFKEVDLSALATAVLQDLRATQPGRHSEFVIAPGVVANGDFGLLRIAIENLLGNAWKYTGKKECARIEFGVEGQGGAPAIFIRDNGAGFDMASAGKLFSTFGRLHSAKEFPGTGIGLSTVQRIIARHGGRIWADAAVDKGATFFFTIGEDRIP